MSRIILSDISCWGNKQLVLQLAKILKFDGIEVMPLINDTQQDYKGLTQMITCLHGAPYVTMGSILTRLKYASKDERTLALIWAILIGTLKSNPAIGLARSLDKPIILHQEQVFELIRYNLESLVVATRIRVENSNFTTHPDNIGDRHGLGKMIEAYDLLEEKGFYPSIVIDFEHLYQSLEEGSYDNITPSLLEKELQKIGRRNVTAFHLSDSMMVDGKRIGHMPLGRGAMALTDLLNFTKEFPKAELVIETGSSMDKWEFLFANQKKRFAYHLNEIAISVDYLRNAIA